MNAEDTKWLFNYFKKSPLFASFPESEINELIDHMDRANYACGDVIFKEGETGEWFFIASRGRIKIQKKKKGFLKTVDTDVGVIGPDDIFGEIALFENKPRTATLVADEDVVCFKLFKSKFDDLRDNSPTFKAELEKLIANRTQKK
jgi:CRP/FNR family transcriptional regulator